MVAIILKSRRTQEVEETVEVEFPVYASAWHDLDDGRVTYTTHYRISADGQKVTVQIWSGHIDLDYEIRLGRISVEHDLDAYLNPKGFMWRKSTAEAFDAALAGAQTALAQALA